MARELVVSRSTSCRWSSFDDQLRRRREPVRAGRQDRPGELRGADADRRHDDADRRPALRRPAARSARRSRAQHRRRDRVDRLHARSTDKFAPTLASARRHAREPDLPRRRARAAARRALVVLKQARDRTSGIAATSSETVVRRPASVRPLVTETSVAGRRSRATIVAFHKAYFQPGHAVITVAGDVKPADVKRTRRAGRSRRWPAGGSMPIVRLSGAAGAEGDDDLSRRQAGGGAVHVRRSACSGPSRNTPDYYALRVMNNDPRRAVPVAAESQHPRSEGLQLRRGLELRVRSRPGRLPRGRRAS